MALYCQITAVTRNRPTGYTVDYEVRDDAPNPDAVVDTGSYGMTFDHARLLDLGTTIAEKRRWIRDELESHFRAHMDQIRAGDAAFAQIEAMLTGQRYPAA